MTHPRVEDADGWRDRACPSGTPNRRRRPIGIRPLLAAVAAALIVVPLAHAHARGCRTTSCDRRAGDHYRRTHERLGPEQFSRATFYSVPPCDNQGTLTASGQTVHFGVIASNWLPLGTRLRFDRPLFGRRYFQVLDTGAPFDVFLPCDGRTRGWSNPTIGFRIVLR